MYGDGDLQELAISVPGHEHDVVAFTQSENQPRLRKYSVENIQNCIQPVYLKPETLPAMPWAAMPAYRGNQDLSAKSRFLNSGLSAFRVRPRITWKAR